MNSRSNCSYFVRLCSLQFARNRGLCCQVCCHLNEFAFCLDALYKQVNGVRFEECSSCEVSNGKLSKHSILVMG